MTKAELEQYIKDRVYPNNAQEITGEGLQEAMLQLANTTVENALSYGVQNLTEEEAEQARRNIGATDFLHTIQAVIRPTTISYFFTENQEFDKIKFIKNAGSLIWFSQGITILLDKYYYIDNIFYRSGTYLDELGFHEVAVAFDFDEGNNEVSVKSISDNIIPIRSINGTAVSLGAGEASGAYAFSQGAGKASGEHAVSLGAGEASGAYAVSIGRNNTSDGAYAVSIGRNNTSDGAYAVSIGQNCKANNSYGFAFGQTITTNNQNEVGFGKYNISVESSDMAEATAFSIGDGSSKNPHNLFEIKKNGDIYINGKKAVIMFVE